MALPRNIRLVVAGDATRLSDLYIEDGSRTLRHLLSLVSDRIETLDAPLDPALLDRSVGGLTLDILGEAEAPSDARRYPVEDQCFGDIVIEGPDGARFAMEGVPTSTLVSDIIRAVANEYGPTFGAPAPGQPGSRQATVDLVADNGSSRRLNPREGLYAAGVRSGAVLRVHPERTAGGNPAMLRVHPERTAEGGSSVHYRVEQPHLGVKRLDSPLTDAGIDPPRPGADPRQFTPDGLSEGEAVALAYHDQVTKLAGFLRARLSLLVHCEKLIAADLCKCILAQTWIPNPAGGADIRPEPVYLELPPERPADALAGGSRLDELRTKISELKKTRCW